MTSAEAREDLIAAHADRMVDQLRDMSPNDAIDTLVAINALMIIRHLRLRAKGRELSVLQAWDIYISPAVRRTLVANFESGIVDQVRRETLR